MRFAETACGPSYPNNFPLTKNRRGAAPRKICQGKKQKNARKKLFTITPYALDKPPFVWYINLMLINEARKLNLSPKHFTIIAEVIGHIDDDDNRQSVTHDFGGLLSHTNKAFDKDRFAAHVEEVNASRWQHDGCGKEDFYSDV